MIEAYYFCPRWILVFNDYKLTFSVEFQHIKSILNMIIIMIRPGVKLELILIRLQRLETDLTRKELPVLFNHLDKLVCSVQLQSLNLILLSLVLTEVSSFN